MTSDRPIALKSMSTIVAPALPWSKSLFQSGGLDFGLDLPAN